MNKKQKSLSRLRDALPMSESANSPATNLENLCKIFLDTTDPAKRERAVRKYVSRQADFNKLIEDNSGLLTAEIEQALIKLATGGTYTEKTIKTTSKGRFTEEKIKAMPPNQKAVEFYLKNILPGKYKQNPGDESGNETGIVGDLLEALKNVK